ncbi:MAG: hypothetical protein V7K28_23705 [Nostoc sp.]
MPIQRLIEVTAIAPVSSVKIFKIFWIFMVFGYWALVLSEAVGAASVCDTLRERREVLGIGHGALGISQRTND